MDDDDENTYVHEAGRNFSIPHQANIPILQENTPFIREYTIFYTYAFFWGGGGGGGGSSGLSRDVSHWKHRHSTTGPFNPASAGPKKLHCQFIPTHHMETDMD